MSEQPQTPQTAPKTERWLLVMLGAFVPVLLAAVVPQGLRIPLLALAAIVLGAGFVLMLKKGTAK